MLFLFGLFVVLNDGCSDDLVKLFASSEEFCGWPYLNWSTPTELGAISIPVKFLFDLTNI